MPNLICQYMYYIVMWHMLHNVTGKHEEEEDKRTESLKEYITGKPWIHFRPF